MASVYDSMQLSLMRVADIDGERTSRSMRNIPRDENYVGWMAFISACFELASTHPEFAATAGEQNSAQTIVLETLEKLAPVLEGIDGSLQKQGEELAHWNVSAAGRNAVIAADVERNWSEIERLGLGRRS